MRNTFGMFRPVKLADGQVTYRGESYPLAGARAEVTDARSGLFGRRHQVTLTVTLADGTTPVTRTATRTGSQATLMLKRAASFAGRLNRAASATVR